MKKTAFILMIITLLSKILGFIREIVLSFFYGVSSISDAYFISLTIPTVIFSFIGVGITTGYIPMFNKIKEAEGINESHKFTNNLTTILIIICTLIVFGVETFPKRIVKLFASGFDGSTLILAVNFTRITVFGIYFTSLIAIYNAFLQNKDKFIVPSILGFIYNIFVILSIYVSYKTNTVLLAMGSVVALLLQFLLLLHFVRKNQLDLRFIPDFKNEHIIKLGKLALPLIFGISISQINVLVDKTIASRITVGGISALSYADRLNSFILSTVVMSISVAVFPMMSKTASVERNNEFIKIITDSIVIISFLLIPATVGSVLFSSQLVELLFARGAFNTQAIKLTSSGLLYYSLGMLGIGLREILSRAFYSMQETNIPVKNAAIGMILNIILNIVLSKFMGISGLAFATSISATITTVLLFISLQKRIGGFEIRTVSLSLFKILCASLLMGIVSKISYEKLSMAISQNISLLLSVFGGMAFYFTLAFFLNIDEFDSIAKNVKSKVRR